jgi:thiamine-phosphate diphosphorylase
MESSVPEKPTLAYPVLMLVTELCPELVDIVSEAVLGGTSLVHLRDAPLGGGEGITIERMRAAMHGTAQLTINNYLEEVWHTGADGLHLKEKQPLQAAVLLHRNTSMLLGRSIHSLESAHEAKAEGMDYVVAGTIFGSDSHRDIRPQGLGFLQHVCRAVAMPVIAIGGITPENAPECLLAGAAGVAVRSGIMRAANPREAAHRYREALQSVA